MSLLQLPKKPYTECYENVQTQPKSFNNLIWKNTLGAYTCMAQSPHRLEDGEGNVVWPHPAVGALSPCAPRVHMSSAQLKQNTAQRPVLLGKCSDPRPLFSASEEKNELVFEVEREEVIYFISLLNFSKFPCILHQY